MEIVEKGELLVLTTGEYSDYELIMICRARQDIDLKSLAEEYRQIRKAQDPPSWWTAQNGFAKWIIVDKNLADEVPYRECWVQFRHGGVITDIVEPESLLGD